VNDLLLTNTYPSGTTPLSPKTCEICNLFQDYSLPKDRGCLLGQVEGVLSWQR